MVCYKQCDYKEISLSSVRSECNKNNTSMRTQSTKIKINIKLLINIWNLKQENFKLLWLTNSYTDIRGSINPCHFVGLNHFFVFKWKLPLKLIFYYNSSLHLKSNRCSSQNVLDFIFNDDIFQYTGCRKNSGPLIYLEKKSFLRKMFYTKVVGLKIIYWMTLLIWPWMAPPRSS